MDATPVLRSRQEQLIEHRFGESMDVLLDRLYTREGLTQAQIAEHLGAGHRSVVRWMAKYGVVTRDRRALAQAEAVA